jgi:Na+:H+ antiporter, NhaA family
VRSLTPFLLIGVALWGAQLSSGIHATIAGVQLAFAIPSRTRINAAEYSGTARTFLDDFDRAETGDLQILTSKGQQDALSALGVAATHVHVPLLRLEHGLHGVVSSAIMPIFALANAGVVLNGVGILLLDRVAIGVVAGLLIGKPMGVMLYSWLAVKAGWAELPAGASWTSVFGVACLAGIVARARCFTSISPSGA